MGDDEIESAQTLTDVHQIELPKLYVFKTDGPRALLTFADSCRGEIDADAFCFGQAQCDRSKIQTVTAAELEDCFAPLPGGGGDLDLDWHGV